MLISTKGRYALRVLVDLAEHQGDRFIPLKEVAQRQQISEKYLESILKILVRNGILSGVRGKGGGYRLAVAPQSCTVGTILRLTEETLAPVACMESSQNICPRRGECRTVSLWQGLNQLIDDYLNNFTIADLMRTAQSDDDF